MAKITSFQLFELIIIPTTILLSLLFMFVVGASFIGESFLNVMGIPTILGIIISLCIIILLFKQNYIVEFSQIETLFRVLAITGGGLVIPLTFLQLNGLLNIQILISLLTLIFTAISGIFALVCVQFLWRIKFTQQSSE